LIQLSVGELKANLDRCRGEKEHLANAMEHIREQKEKAECQLTEVNQLWNDAKWRLNFSTLYFCII
jgi:chromosome segregation ATPase